MESEGHGYLRWGIIALLDALGARNYDEKECEHFLYEMRQLRGHLNWRGTNTVLSSPRPLPSNLQAPVTRCFGDTILLSWELPNDVDPTTNLGTERYLLPAAMLLSEAMAYALEVGIKLRGAISIGPFYQDSDTIIGPAVADAAAWHEQPEFIGLIATPLCGLRLAKVRESFLRQNSKLILEEYFVETEVHFKSKITTAWCLNWPKRFVDEIGEHSDIPPYEVLIDRLCRGGIPYGTEEKYSNTLAFWNECQKFRLSGPNCDS